MLRKATRTKAKLKIGISGPSGSGKTYSALLLGKGLASAWNKIAIIDTENGSADLYDHLGGYNVLTLKAPFTPESYIEAIHECERAGMEVIIVDSMSHEWEGKGGILETHSALPGNSFTNWGKITPRHNKFIDSILQSPVHIICTMRSKQDYVLNERDGKQVPQKVGLKAVTREGVDYEFTLVFDIDIKHNATASKDRTELFVDKPEFTINEQTGKELRAWAEKGTERIVEPVKDSVAVGDEEHSVDIDALLRDGLDEPFEDKYLDSTEGKSMSRSYYANAKKAGYDAEKAKEIIKKHYKLESYTDVSKDQLVAMNEAMKKKVQKG